MAKSEEEIDEAAKQFLADQAEYNKSHNKEILWFKMEPYLRETTESMIKLKSKGHFVRNFEEKVDLVVDKLMKRYIENPDYNYELPLTLVYWATISVIYSESMKSLDFEEKFKAMLKENLFDKYRRNLEYEDL